MLLSTFLAVAAQAQTDSGSSSSTVPRLTIASSHVVAASSEEATFTVTASSALSSDLPVSVHVRALGLSMDTRTVADVVLLAGATTVTLRLEQVAESIAESRVDVTLTLAGGTGYSVGDPAEATVSIDYPSISGTLATPTPTPTPAVSPPDAPSGVSITAPSISSFTVSWTAEAGKTYRVEREAAYLFSYRVWQTVADNLSTGSFTENGLPCDLYYVYRVQAKIAGSPYGAGMAALATPQSCTGARSARGSTTRGPTDRPFQLRLVTDNPTQTSIQIRLLFHGDPNPLQYRPVFGLDTFQVDRSNRKESGQPLVWPNPPIRKEGSNAEFHWEGLECSASYYFRARGEGDGSDFDDVYGPWSTDVHGSTRGCTKPEVDVIPLPQRRARLRWNNINGASTYEVRVAKPGEAIGNLVPPGCSASYAATASATATQCDIYLDNIIGGDGLADLDAGEGYRFRVTVRFTDTSRASQFSDVIIVDSPIRSVNGDSREGKMEVRWNPAGSDARYTVRWRRISDKDTNPHSSENWQPVEWRPDSRYDWDSAITSSTEYDINNSAKGIVDEEIYAVQLNYTIGSDHPGAAGVVAGYFSAREHYGWVSSQRGGGRVGNFPLNFPLNDPLAPNNKTYAYRICADTFASDETEQNEWIALIDHALVQWESATDGLVMMEPVLDGNGNRAPCANYADLHQEVVNHVSAVIIGLTDTGTLELTTVTYIDEFIRTLEYLGDFHGQDVERNEVLMVDIDLHRLTMFKGNELDEFSISLGLGTCIFEENVNACASGTRTGIDFLGIRLPPIDFLGKQFTTDIQLRSDRFENTNLTLPSVSFNTCVTANSRLYADLIHEAGHALGIGGLPDEDAEIKNHPPLVDSVVNYNENSEVLLNVVGGKANLREPDCSPHPLDIMAIYALYQTVD